jgi:hypothetical protein
LLGFDIAEKSSWFLVIGTGEYRFDFLEKNQMRPDPIRKDRGALRQPARANGAVQHRLFEFLELLAVAVFSPTDASGKGPPGCDKIAVVIEAPNRHRRDVELCGDLFVRN